MAAGRGRSWRRRTASPSLRCRSWRLGPRALGLAQVPGCYWPFRSFPLALGAGAARHGGVRSNDWRHTRDGVRIGPVYDGDPAAAALLAAARRAGLGGARPVRGARAGCSTWPRQRRDGVWPRLSTLRKNRFHEKHLAGHGALDWRFLDGTDWPAGVRAARRGRGAELDRDPRPMAATRSSPHAGHLAFWQAAARDPVLAGMFHAALLTVDGAPAAFSFDLDAGETKYAIANSYVPAFAKHSPGKLLYWRNLVDALDRGITRVDWGAGDSGYKQVIGAEPGPALRDWLLLRPGMPAAAGRALGMGLAAQRQQGDVTTPLPAKEREPTHFAVTTSSVRRFSN